MGNQQIRIRLSSTEERKGLLRGIFPTKRVNRVLDLNSLPEELKNDAKDYAFYQSEMERYEKEGHPYSITMKEAAIRHGWKVLTGLEEYYGLKNDGGSLELAMVPEFGLRSAWEGMKALLK